MEETEDSCSRVSKRSGTIVETLGIYLHSANRFSVSKKSQDRQQIVRFSASKLSPHSDIRSGVRLGTLGNIRKFLNALIEHQRVLHLIANLQIVI